MPKPEFRNMMDPNQDVLLSPFLGLCAKETTKALYHHPEETSNEAKGRRFSLSS
jgi:hypothetical protein